MRPSLTVDSSAGRPAQQQLYHDFIRCFIFTSQRPCCLKSGMGWWSLGSSGSKADPEKSKANDSKSSNRRQQEEGEQSFIPPPLTSRTSSSSSSKSTTDWNSSLNAFDWSQFKEPRNLIPTALLTGGILFVVYVQRRYLRRFPKLRISHLHTSAQDLFWDASQVLGMAITSEYFIRLVVDWLDGVGCHG